MSARVVLATARRVLVQLRHDPRTIVLLLVAPCLLIALIKLVFDGGPTFDRIGGPLLGLFPLLSMFLVTSIAMLRERTTGTLERLLTTPMAKLDLLMGYGVAFAVAAVVQASLASLVAFGPLGLEVEGAPLAVVGLAIANALLGMALGLFVSALRVLSSRRCSSCRPSSFRSCCSAGCWPHAARWRSRWSSRRRWHR
jgi:ABC-2 type transport system permease protein